MIENNKILTLEIMKNMSIDQIVELYKDGYRLDEFVTLQNVCPLNDLVRAGAIGFGVGALFMYFLLGITGHLTYE